MVRFVKRDRAEWLYVCALMLVLGVAIGRAGASTYSYLVPGTYTATTGTFGSTGNAASVDFRNATFTEAVSGGGYYAEGTVVVSRTTLSTNAFTANAWDAILITRGSTSAEPFRLSVMDCSGAGAWIPIHVYGTTTAAAFSYNVTTNFEQCGSSVSFLLNSSLSTPDVAADVLTFDQFIVDFRLYVVSQPSLDGVLFVSAILLTFWISFVAIGAVSERPGPYLIVAGISMTLLAIYIIPYVPVMVYIMVFGVAVMTLILAIGGMVE